ncbi:GNAT family N-acetyltransferase [Microbacterium rhizomatis]|uniref:GNAT family N-acetyltransferase n=1 Tax=Microbacterium rhizomatis TaxID=1631477 RepID=A0A5J5J8P6_9MICO|nr:GNAT family N-acetyltransferase [Microbacterium rhizomatis]KAA9111544.1 GNAT family N-acetyltransferase [Microbacterium rhizomatis]
MIDLRTARLTLRPWTDSADDLAFLFDMYSREEVQRYIGVTPQLMQSTDEARERVARWKGMHDGCRGVWGVTLHDGTRLGTVLCKRISWSAGAVEKGAVEKGAVEVGLAPQDTGQDAAQDTGRDAEQDTEIGWHFHPDAWGRGYASEAATAVLRHAFEAGLERVVAVTNPANTASQRVCLRIGMTDLGPTTSYYDTTCELFELAAPGRRCVAFFRNVNQGQRGHPSGTHLGEAMTDAGFLGSEGFRANGIVVGTAVGAPAQLAADTADALAARSGLQRAVFVLAFDEVADIVDAFAPVDVDRLQPGVADGVAPDEVSHLEFSVFDRRVVVEGVPVRGIHCEVIASGHGWAVTRNDHVDRSQGTPTIERLIGSPVTSRGMSTMRGLVRRYS